MGRRKKINRDGNKKGVIERWKNKALRNCSEESISSWRAGIDESLQKGQKG